MLTLEELQKKVYSLGEKIGVNKDSDLYPLFSENSQIFSEGASIYIGDSKYHYIVMERGQIQKDLQTTDINDILYEIFNKITASLARKFELEQRKETKDSRRIWFKKQLELLNEIDSQFVELRTKEMEEVLKISPFRD